MFGFFKGRLVFIRICLVTSVVLLVAIGVASIYAVGNPVQAPSADGMGALQGKYLKQLAFFALGTLGFVGINLVNYRVLGEISLWLFAGVLLLLTVLLVSKFYPLAFAPRINGTHRWIRLSPALPAIQPSEFCKLAYILALAWYLRFRKNYGSLNALVGPFAFTLLPMVLILAEPDLGTVLLLMPILFVMLFVAGAEVKHLVLILIAAAAVSPFLWQRMPSYQRQRISSVLLQNEKVRQATESKEWLQVLLADRGFSAEDWMRDGGYQLIRSKDAIASAGWTGYGFRRGPFMKYNFLPARETDFIFASIAHQWGFLGCMVLVVLYAVIVLCGLEIASNNTDPFGRLVVVGILTMFVIEVFVNISMTVGVMPITGLTLPFVSYGGSSLLVNLMSVGLLNNIGRCRAFTVAKTE